MAETTDLLQGFYDRARVSMAVIMIIISVPAVPVPVMIMITPTSVTFPRPRVEALAVMPRRHPMRTSVRRASPVSFVPSVMVTYRIPIALDP